MANFIRHISCEKCGSSDANALYDDNSQYCFACNAVVRSDSTNASRIVREKKIMTNEDIKQMTDQTKDVLDMEEYDELKTVTTTKPGNFRGIRDDTNTKFGVRYFLEDGQVIKQYCPVTEEGQLVGLKVRTIPKSFATLGRVGKKSDLFMQFRFTKGGKYLLITESEVDALSAYQMLNDYNASKGSPFETAVVSSLIGANCASQLKQNYKFIDSFDQIILCFDNDKAGQEATEDAVISLPKGKIKVMKMRMKDANEYLQAGKEKEFVIDFYNAETYVPVGVLGSSQLFDKILAQALTQKVEFPPFMNKLNDKLVGGMPLGHIINIGAKTGIGKCLGKDTKVRMYDLSVKNVQDIVDGDLVMGADGTARKVVGVTSGTDKLYKISQKKGMSYIVNSAHILSLRQSANSKHRNRNDVLNINVEDYLKLDITQQRLLKGYKCSLLQVEDTEISIKYIGEGEYYGFELEGKDKLFCLEDFTVTHNTTLVNELVYHWVMNSPYKAGVVSMELDSGQYGEVLLSRHLSSKLALMRSNEDKNAFLSNDIIKKRAAELFTDDNGNDRFFVLDNRDGSVEEIQNTIEELIISCGCKIIILDPLQDILAGLSVDEQELFMKWVKGSIKSHGVTFILINHMRKSQGPAHDVDEEDFQGSSTIIKSASVNIILSRDKSSDDDVERNTTRITVTKNRITGLTGPAGEVYYDNQSHTLYDIDEFFTDRHKH